MAHGLQNISWLSLGPFSIAAVIQVFPALQGPSMDPKEASGPCIEPKEIKKKTQIIKKKGKMGLLFSKRIVLAL